MAFRRPDPDISPGVFFERWLPDEVRRLAGGAALPEVTVRVALQGEGGGCWLLRSAAAGLTVVSCPDEGGGDQGQLVDLRLSVADWRAITVGEPGPVDLAPTEASPTDLLFIDSASRPLLESIRGTVRFEVHDYNGRTWVLCATFGGAPPADPPDAALAVAAETYGAILARRLSPAEAYFGGKIRVTGDQALGMQVGLVLLPKF